jgi:hypothetical protein
MILKVIEGNNNANYVLHNEDTLTGIIVVYGGVPTEILDVLDLSNKEHKQRFITYLVNAKTTVLETAGMRYGQVNPPTPQIVPDLIITTTRYYFKKIDLTYPEFFTTTIIPGATLPSVSITLPDGTIVNSSPIVLPDQSYSKMKTSVELDNYITSLNSSSNLEYLIELLPHYAGEAEPTSVLFN